MSKLVGRSSSNSGDGKYEKDEDEDEVTETGGCGLCVECQLVYRQEKKCNKREFGRRANGVIFRRWEPDVFAGPVCCPRSRSGRVR